MFKWLIYAVIIAASFSKSDYFRVIQGNDVISMDKMLLKITEASVASEKNAYLGALKMKRAGFESTASKKLEMFKQGKLLLESAISKNPSNTEFRFLRLMIQENAPKILKYNMNLDEDCQFIAKNYQTLNADLKQEMMQYARSSVHLKL